MGAPKIYFHTDDEAPQLNGNPGSLQKILRACLVDGYGTKEAAGWTMPFVKDDNLTVAVFRNNPETGTGMFYQFSDTVSYGAECTLKGFETMSTYDTGINIWPAVSGFPFKLGSISPDAPEPHRWTIIADDRCFYIFTAYYSEYYFDLYSTNHEYTAYFCAQFVGDFIAIDPNDAFATTIILHASNPSQGSYLTFGYPPNSTPHGYQFVPRFMDGAHADSTDYKCLLIGGPFDSYASGSPTYAFDYPYFGREILTTPIVSNGAARTFRGYMPGLRLTPHEMPWGNNEVFTDDDGKEYMCVWCRGLSAAYGCIVIDITEDFRP